MRRSERNLPDTNILIRYLTRDDEALYTRAKEFFDRVKEGSTKAVILESVIAECIYVLTKIYMAPKIRAAESLIDILHYKGIVNHDGEELIRALRLFSEWNIDIVDCILCVKAAGPNTSLFSFDSALNKIECFPAIADNRNAP
jgi:predicted nucleic-acid-binding protein